MNNLAHAIANELTLGRSQVARVIQLLDDGNTIPFIARYRKEQTGALDEEQLRSIAERLEFGRKLQARKEEVLRLLEDQGNLTPELRTEIESAEQITRVDDLYRPFRPKRRTRATMAMERGLGPLADRLWEQRNEAVSLDDLAVPFVDPGNDVPDAGAALAGARDILAERISDDADVRELLRRRTLRNGTFKCVRATSPEVEEADSRDFATYFDFSERIERVRAHQVLAINRGERLGVLKASVEVAAEPLEQLLVSRTVRNVRAAAYPLLVDACVDAYRRLLAPAVERDVRGRLTEEADRHATRVFAQNLRALLLQAPVHGHVVMGIDPGFRTGCKVAVVNPRGELLDTDTIYPHPPQRKEKEALATLEHLASRHGVTLVAIGNGTASRETEQLAARLIQSSRPQRAAQSGPESALQYTIVNEAGASVYSASPLAKTEFPDLDVSMRGAVSIARRVQDPLAELVKIDPKSIGVGLYQHDVDQKELSESLDSTVESCVNFVGVDLNTASPKLLQYVAGVKRTTAQSIVDYRSKVGGFRRRAELLDVPKLGPKTFEQCAGFMRIPTGENPLDRTPVHPESYRVAEDILRRVGSDPGALADPAVHATLRARLGRLDPDATADELGAGAPTVKDILEALMRPGRDPRADLPGPVFRSDVVNMEDLAPGMRLTGVVQNVVDFGAFVDIGVKKAGLVHVSEMADRFVKDPNEVVQVGDSVEVRVLEVDLDRQRIALSMRRHS